MSDLCNTKPSNLRSILLMNLRKLIFNLRLNTDNESPKYIIEVVLGRTFTANSIARLLLFLYNIKEKCTSHATMNALCLTCNYF